MSEAPRDKAIKLYLPGLYSTLNARGYAEHSDPGECTGIWLGTRWIDQKSGQTVYPSQWTDA